MNNRHLYIFHLSFVTLYCCFYVRYRLLYRYNVTELVIVLYFDVLYRQVSERNKKEKKGKEGSTYTNFSSFFMTPQEG